MRDFLNTRGAMGIGGPPPKPKPKPKPVKKTPSVVITDEKMEEGSSEDAISPDQPIVSLGGREGGEGERYMDYQIVFVCITNKKGESAFRPELVEYATHVS